AGEGPREGYAELGRESQGALGGAPQMGQRPARRSARGRTLAFGWDYRRRFSGASEDMRGWLCRERPRGPMRASRIAVLSLIGLLLIGAAAVLLLRMPKPATVTDGIAARYPGDVGIETDPEVFFVERFDEGTIT